MADPTDIPVVDELSLLLQTPIQPAVGTPSAIQEALKRGQGTQRVLEEARESFKIQLLHGDENGEEVLSIDKIQADPSPIIRLVDSAVFDALNRRASDIHIETRDNEVVIKYRIDGVLQPAMKPIAKEHHSTIISRIKVMAELDIAEKRVPQDGRFRVQIEGRSVDFRVSIMPSVHGEDAVIRILDKESLSKQFASLRLDVLGFDEKELARFRRFIREPYGMVLVTGPTGSGKTTTLYAALSEIKTEEDKIITIEDPVEYQLQGHHPDPGEREEGADVRARPALDPAPRPRQDHGGGDPRRGDGRHRDPVRAHRPPGVHDRPRQQRHRRAGPLPQHEDRALQLRVRAQLRAGPAPGAHDLRALQARGAGRRATLLVESRAWTRSSTATALLRGRGLPRVRRHRLQGPHGDLASCSTSPTTCAS